MRISTISLGLAIVVGFGGVLAVAEDSDESERDAQGSQILAG